MGDVANQGMGLDIYLSSSGKFARLPALPLVKQDLAIHELDRDTLSKSIAKKHAKSSNSKRFHSFLRPLVIVPVLIVFIIAGGLAFELPFTNDASNLEGASNGAAATHQTSQEPAPTTETAPAIDTSSAVTAPSSPNPSVRRPAAISTTSSSSNSGSTPSVPAVLPATDMPQPAETNSEPQISEEPTELPPTEPLGTDE